jgi:tRNA U34 5-methylaminomethyl-2-thiouridine-forming methyltransferase MnmC
MIWLWNLIEPSPPPKIWATIPTADGSATFYSPEFEEAFHSHTGAAQEALGKFVYPSGLLDVPEPVRVLDICYGLGYNTAAFLEQLWTRRPGTSVELFALEIEPTVAQQAIPLLQMWPKAVNALTDLATNLSLTQPHIQAQLLVGDARQTIAQIPLGWADGIFLDPFAPERCPMLWSVEFLTLVAQRLKPTGRLVTYACGAAARSALLASGLTLGSTAPVGRRSPGTVANWIGGLPPLSLQEQEHLQTKASIPYRDPTLQADRNTLQLQRRLVQDTSTLEPSSHWRKRWQTKR